MSEEREREKTGYVPAPPKHDESPLYEGEEGAPRGRGESSYKPYIIMGIIALVIVFLMNSFIMPTAGKKVYESDITRLETDLVAMREYEKSLGTRIDGLNSSISELNTSINSAVSKADSASSATGKIGDLTSSVSALTIRIDGLTGKVGEGTSSLESSINDIKARLATIEADIIALKKKESVTPVASSGITATVKTMSNVLIATSNTTMSGSIRIELKNNTNVAVSDIVLNLSIQTDIIKGISTPSTGTLTGGGTIWQGQGIPWNMAEFMNTQWGLNLNANETKTIYLTYTVNGNGFTEPAQNYQIYGVPFQVNVTVF